MDRPKSAMPGFVLLIGLIALAAAGKAILYDTLDPDCFWHLRVAEQLQAEGIRPLIDRLSFASIKQPWTPYSWLAELGMKWLWDFGGFRAAVAAQAICQAAFIVLIAMTCRQVQRADVWEETDGKLSTAVATMVAAYWSLAYLSFRPVTFALVLLAGCAFLVARDRQLGERSKAIWWIIPLTTLITNVHLFAALVPAAMFALTSGAFVEARSRRGTMVEEATRRLRRLVLLTFTTGIACLFTPMLRGAIKTALFYAHGDAMVAGPIISEMQSFAAGPMGKIAAGLVLLTFFCASRHRDRLRIGEWILLIAATLLLLKLGRFSPVFAIIAAPVLATTFPKLSDRVLSRTPIAVLLSIVVGIGTARVIRHFPKPDQTLSAWLNRHGPDAPGYPCAAADFVDARVRPATGRIINEFSWGGYLEWRLGDRYRVLLDGRTQVFDRALWRYTYLGDALDRQKFLSEIVADAAVLPAGKSLFRTSLLKLGWTSAYRDDRAEVLLPPDHLVMQGG